MPLPFQEIAPLNIPTERFNANGLYAMTIQGGRYGDRWVIYLPEPCTGGIETDINKSLVGLPEYADRGVESLFIWVREAAEAASLRIVAWHVRNDEYPETDRLYCCAVNAVFASAAFVPAEGVVYADEMTIDAAMRGGR